jgi:hypothetical protein
MPLFKRRCIAAARVFETRNWASRKAALLDARPGGTTTGLPRYKILLSKIEHSAAAQKRGKCRLCGSPCATAEESKTEDTLTVAIDVKQ